MASSAFKTAQYHSEQFVESSGAVLFDFSQEIPKVCLIYYIEKDEWLLAKGRRNYNESRREAALREVREETGYQCRLYPISMPTRATNPSATDTNDMTDQARVYHNLTEPFMLSIREIKERSSIKLIWWYIAELEKNVQTMDGEAEFISEFFSYDEAIRRLTFQGDRDVLIKAVSLVHSSCASDPCGQPRDDTTVLDWRSGN
ncbi:hypothetical protein MGYG_04299 [Nannizzia gypsea CBS 118893]|uniref:Nudix hydrolase domain-containing protein n=1 Tax=Arthroderma gypseum (strain ATCC MYA-4604 / CBS 118893) TaxID=535722 RepID=E4US90_ARTGP|nr:hypothetical protein MGYG_04299 [Nannizzia gypsea CBS 118893]EFR01294.1 hypothetical protein MGYG_04299 [Nannizzia gypsea CBS 118893]